MQEFVVNHEEFKRWDLEWKRWVVITKICFFLKYLNAVGKSDFPSRTDIISPVTGKA